MVTKPHVPATLEELIVWAWPDYRIARSERHSDECWTVLVVRQDHHALRMRFNRGLDERWTMCPLSQDYLTVG